MQAYVKRSNPETAHGSEAAQQFRKTAPVVKPCNTGSAAKVQQMMDDPDSFKVAMEEFQNDKFAAPNLASTQARHKWWLLRAASCGVDPYPLTVEKVD